MRKKFAISMVVVALLLTGIMATSVLASDTNLTNSASLAKNTNVSNQLRANAISVEPNRAGPVGDVSPASANSYGSPPPIIADEREKRPEIDVESLQELVPITYEETDLQILQRTRYLLYTHDGKHVMWGFVGNGFFVGEDNLDKRCWGIYGNGIFAGFYDGEFFWGKYRNGNWKAEGLFGENYTHGKYILFPATSTEP